MTKLFRYLGAPFISETQILIFVRFPTAGQAKTRLIPALGSLGAARLHRRMTEHAVRTARAVREADKDVRITVCFTGAPTRDFRAWLGLDLQYESQPAGDLGNRMRTAFESAFVHGAKRVVGIGSDAPELSEGILHQALEDLRVSDVVLGPANDGGYYLIGMRRLHPRLFTGIRWGANCVYAQTREAIIDLNLKAKELPVLNDVDRPEDLSLLRMDPDFADVFTAKPLVSVIISTLNEAQNIGRVLTRVQRADAVEVIVVDGGSQDNTCQIAEKADAVVLEVSGGRAAQQNAGAKAANGRLLFFLHADTLPPEGYADFIRAAMDSPCTVAGAFRFQTDAESAAMRLVEWAVNLRSTLLQLPYGDQGIFVEKRVFHEIGAFALLPIMEDFELMVRLRRRGRVATLGAKAMTSARRWEQLGIIRTTIINQIMVAGFFCGAPVHWLYRRYRSGKVIYSTGNQRKENLRA